MMNLTVPPKIITLQRVARKFNIGVTPEILLDYRVHKNRFPVKKRRTVKQRRQSAQHAAGMAGYFTG